LPAGAAWQFFSFQHVMNKSFFVNITLHAKQDKGFLKGEDRTRLAIDTEIE